MGLLAGAFAAVRLDAGLSGISSVSWVAALAAAFFTGGDFIAGFVAGWPLGCAFLPSSSIGIGLRVLLTAGIAAVSFSGDDFFAGR